MMVLKDAYRLIALSGLCCRDLINFWGLFGIGGSLGPLIFA